MVKRGKLQTWMKKKKLIASVNKLAKIYTNNNGSPSKTSHQCSTKSFALMMLCFLSFSFLLLLVIFLFTKFYGKLKNRDRLSEPLHTKSLYQESRYLRRLGSDSVPIMNDAFVVESSDEENAKDILVNDKSKIIDQEDVKASIIDRVGTNTLVEDNTIIIENANDLEKEKKLNERRCPDGVDLVVTWVNGSDPLHIKQRKYYSAKDTSIKTNNEDTPLLKTANLEQRFRDYEKASTLKFLLRSQEIHAPWIKNVYIVTANGQKPSYLKYDKNSRIQIVPHETIFKKPESDLPTFNSCAIEVNIHRIPGLSECYMYLNDDFLFLSPTSINEFFPSASEKPYSFTNNQLAPITPRGQDEWGLKNYHVSRMLQRRTKMKRSDIHLISHSGTFFKKSIVNEIESFFANEFEETSSMRWRSELSLWLPFIYNNWLFWKYNSERKAVSAQYIPIRGDSHVDELVITFEKLINSKSKKKWLCLNDVADDNDQVSDKTIDVLYDGLMKLFPRKSSYET